METTALARILDNIWHESREGIVTGNEVRTAVRRADGTRSVVTAGRLVRDGYLELVPGGDRSQRTRTYRLLSKVPLAPRPQQATVPVTAGTPAVEHLQGALETFSSIGDRQWLRELEALTDDERARLAESLEDLAWLVRLLERRVRERRAVWES